MSHSSKMARLKINKNYNYKTRQVIMLTNKHTDKQKDSVENMHVATLVEKNIHAAYSAKSN